MAQSDKSKARSPWLSPAWAALAVALWLLGWGCLNPWPDDYPSNESGATTIDPPELPSDDIECGEGNPLLQDCEDSEAPGSVDNQTPEDSEDGPDDPSGNPDASADAGRRDAGTPDAGVTANE